ncbi:MAG TPA: STAS domain-containing protein [Jatrophihabitans sp.]|jgi:rsbT co-antagonist protein RsbR|nr:STAS domain-containing protein [Jatrophihabitans sp.]
MAADLTGIASTLGERRPQVLDRWIDITAGTVRGRITRPEMQGEMGALLDAILSGMGGGSTTATDGFGEARALLAELSRSRAQQGFSPSETATSVFALKQAALDVIDVEGGDAVDFVNFNALLDEFALITFETYAEARDRIINQQAEEMLELSTPVVKLWEGVLAVPLVGTLDSARTQVVTEKLLQTLVDTGSEHAIIDITGVSAVDTQVAQHLLKTVVAARLMGAECIISGIRPQIAQTIVALGIQFGDIATKATLADALLLALRKSGVNIRARTPEAR